MCLGTKLYLYIKSNLPPSQERGSGAVWVNAVNSGILYKKFQHSRTQQYSVIPAGKRMVSHKQCNSTCRLVNGWPDWHRRRGDGPVLYKAKYARDSFVLNKEMQVSSTILRMYSLTSHTKRCRLLTNKAVARNWPLTCVHRWLYTVQQPCHKHGLACVAVQRFNNCFLKHCFTEL